MKQKFFFTSWDEFFLMDKKHCIYIQNHFLLRPLI